VRLLIYREKMRLLLSVLIPVIVSWSTIVDAQTIPLPKIDSINFFGQAGEFEGHDVTDAKNFAGFGSYGWGFETSFEMAAKGAYVAELAVGYEQLFLNAKLDQRFAMHGTVRDLPSISVYVSFPNNLYVGVGTGVTSLVNTTITDSTSRFTVTGDTFDVAAKAGYVIPLGGGDSLTSRRINAFIEGSYHARQIGGVNYSMGAPANLPSRLYIGGGVVAVGVQVSLKTTTSLSDDQIKKEAQRQQQAFAAMSPSPDNVDLVTKTVCRGTQIEAGWIEIDTRWDPSSCTKSETIEQNVWVLGRFSDPNDPNRIEVCSSATIPSGWKSKGTRWVPGRCGAGADSITQNVTVMERQ